MITDKQAAQAVDTIRRYCEEHQECVSCILDCVMLKHGSAPCYWTPPLVDLNETQDDISEAIKYFEQELESVSAFPAQALLVVQDERKHLETALGVLRKVQDGK